MNAHLLGLDVGTSLIKAVVFDLDGTEDLPPPHKQSRCRRHNRVGPSMTWKPCGLPRRQP